MNPHDLLTVKEYADLVRQHPMSIYRRIREDRQPGVRRFGRDIRIDVTEALQIASGIISPLTGGREPALGGLFKRV